MYEAATDTSQRPPIVVHHLENARSQRILWLLEELEVPYEVKRYLRTPQKLAPKELQDVHPLGKSPVIVDGGLTIAESGAIIEYLIATYGKEKDRVPQGDRSKWLDNLFFTHYAEGSVQPVLVRRLLCRTLPQTGPDLMRMDETMNAPDLKKHGEHIEAHLQKTGGWFAGGDNPTSADYMMTLTVEIFLNRAAEYAGENMKKYIQRVQDRPAYKRAIERGGEYAYLLK